MSGVRDQRGDFYDYQPGNMTRYYIYARRTLDFDGDDSLAVFWLREGDTGGSGMTLKTDIPMHLGYFMEKTRIKNECDCVALLCFMREVFGVEIEGIPAAYQRLDWVKNAEARAA